MGGNVMKKLLVLIVALFTFVMMNVPFGGTAEAAYVAVVPIDIDVDKNKAMSSELADSINSRSLTISNPLCYLEDAFKEKNTGKGRRSDIIIRCNDTLNICIEKKTQNSNNK